MIVVVHKVRDFDRGEISLHNQFGDFIGDGENLNHRLPSGVPKLVAMDASGTGSEDRVT